MILSAPAKRNFCGGGFVSTITLALEGNYGCDRTTRHWKTNSHQATQSDRAPVALVKRSVHDRAAV